MKSLVILMLLISSTSVAKELTWQEIESALLSGSPSIQRDELTLKADQHLAKTGLTPFLPELAVVGGVGNKDTIDSPEKGTQGYLRGRWNLFRGFRDSSARTRLKAQEDLSGLNLEISKKRLVLETKEIFYSLLMLEKQSEILKKELKVNAQQKAMAGRKVSAGLTSSVDTLEFELRDNTILAQIRRVEAEANKKKADLKSILDIPEAEGIEIKGELQLPPKNAVPFRADSFVRVQQAKFELDIAKSENAEIRADYLPEVNLEAQFGRITLQESTPARNDESNYLLSVSIPIFSAFDTFYKSRAQASRQLAAEREVRVRQLEIERDISSLKTKWDESWNLYELNHQALQRITKYYDLTLSEYKRGVKNSPDVVSATERFFEKQVEQLELLKELNALEAQFQNLY